MGIKIFHLTRQICGIQCKFFGHQLIFHCKCKHLHFKSPELFQRGTFLSVAAECLQIEPDTVGSVILKLLFKNPQSFAVDLIF